MKMLNCHFNLQLIKINTYICIMTNTNTCNKCLQEKPLSDFPKGSRMTLGIINNCKKCTSRYSTFKAKANNIYLPSTAEWELYEYFCSHHIHIQPKQLESLLNRLRMADSYFGELSKIEKELDISAANYELNLNEVKYFEN